MKYVFIQNHREAFPVTLLCQVLEVGTSGFYAWLPRPESLPRRANRRLLVELKVVHQRSRQTYGSPRVHAELNDIGVENRLPYPLQIGGETNLSDVP